MDAPEKLTELLDTVFHGTSCAASIRDSFTRMHIVEQLFEKHLSGTSKRAQPFREMMPSPILRGCTLDVYRSHVLELIARFKKKQLLDWPTDAEMIQYFILVLTPKLVVPENRNLRSVFYQLVNRTAPLVAPMLLKELENWASREYTHELVQLELDVRGELALSFTQMGYKRRPDV